MHYTLKNGDCPEHLFRHVHAALQEWGWLVPSWVAEINVRSDFEDSAPIKAKIAYEYRTVHIAICCGWTKIAEEERSRAIMHELLHIHTNHVWDVFHDLLDATVEENTKLHNWAKEKARQAVEMATSDLERALWEHPQFRDGAIMSGANG